MDVNLVVVKGTPRGRTLSFGPGEYLFGRGPECHVRPDSEWVSRQHCLLVIDDSTVLLKDLGSTNGTLVSGQRLVGERSLVHGDTIQIGPMVLQMRLPEHDAALEALKQTELPTGDVTLATDPASSQVDTVKLPSKRKSE